MKRAKHAEPHFNAAGGCICTCRRCLRVMLEQHDDHIDIEQHCCCRRCSEDCPAGRTVFGKVLRS